MVCIYVELAKLTLRDSNFDIMGKINRREPTIQLPNVYFPGRIVYSGYFKWFGAHQVCISTHTEIESTGSYRGSSSSCTLLNTIKFLMHTAKHQHSYPSNWESFFKSCLWVGVLHVAHNINLIQCTNKHN